MKRDASACLQSLTPGSKVMRRESLTGGPELQAVPRRSLMRIS